MYDYLVSNPVPAESLVPVPLSWKRLKERGYNQSGLLPKELSKLTGLPVLDGCVIRRRHTPPQARTATVSERRQNVADAFVCHDDRLKGKQVLLIDDVATSGATLEPVPEHLKPLAQYQCGG
jgi:predicted amidophosphoribosyltransferase